MSGSKEQGYKTVDGFILEEGDECFVMLQCIEGTHQLSTNLRKARYMDKTAKENGWDFTIPTYPGNNKFVCGDCACEIAGVWKNK